MDPRDWLATTARITFGDLLIALYTRRFTGSVTFHFFSGTATSCEIPRDPVQIRLDGPVVDTTGILGDTPR